MSTVELTPAFHARRRLATLQAMHAEGLDALLVANGPTMAYLTGFFHITTERPIVFGMLASGETFAITRYGLRFDEGRCDRI
jgi:Xaa-Pro aminopeptidase